MRFNGRYFYYKNQYNENDYVNPYNLRAGVVIKELEESMEYLLKGDPNSIDSTSIPFILQAVLKKTRQDFNKFKEDTDMILDLVIKELEELKGEKQDV